MSRNRAASTTSMWMRWTRTAAAWWGSLSLSTGAINLTLPLEDKPAPDFGYNFQMYAAGYAYNVKVEGMPSDILNGAGMGDVINRFKGIHTSYYVTFQRATR